MVDIGCPTVGKEYGKHVTIQSVLIRRKWKPSFTSLSVLLGKMFSKVLWTFSPRSPFSPFLRKKTEKNVNVHADCDRQM